jgi:chorismate dehydratase
MAIQQAVEAAGHELMRAGHISPAGGPSSGPEKTWLAPPLESPVRLPGAVRLGCVPYLNARPLICALAAEGSPFLAEPAHLSGALRDGKVDAALVPVIEVFEGGEYDLVDGVGIACFGPVFSVILVLDKPLRDVMSVAFDPDSRTSSALLRYLFQSFLKREVAFVTPRMHPDARLLIGDPAIRYRQENPKAHVLDLGALWHSWTRLPFVFAVWALRRIPGRDNEALARALRAAAQAGLEERAALSASPAEYRYLTTHIRYHIGPAEKAGLRRFGELWAAEAEREKLPELRWI